MFAKFRQNIAEEELTSVSSRSFPASLNVRQAKVYGWSEKQVGKAKTSINQGETFLRESSVTSLG